MPPTRNLSHLQKTVQSIAPGTQKPLGVTSGSARSATQNEVARFSKPLKLCCRIALVLEYFQFEKSAETMQKNGTDKCNSEKGKNDKCKFEKGKHDNCKKNGIEKCKFQKGETNNCKTNALNNVSLREDTVANEDNLERGTGDKWRTIGKNKGKLEEDTHNVWKNIARNATWEKGTGHMQHKSKQQISLDRVVKPAQRTRET